MEEKRQVVYIPAEVIRHKLGGSVLVRAKRGRLINVERDEVYTEDEMISLLGMAILASKEDAESDDGK